MHSAEHQRIDAFELWCWRRLVRVPWTARRSNQSILKEISHGCSLEGLMLKLKLQYLGHLMRRADSFENTLMLGKIEGRRRRGQQRMRWLDGSTPQPQPQGLLAHCLLRLRLDSVPFHISPSGVAEPSLGFHLHRSRNQDQLQKMKFLNCSHPSAQSLRWVVVQCASCESQV